MIDMSIANKVMQKMSEKDVFIINNDINFTKKAQKIIQSYDWNEQYENNQHSLKQYLEATKVDREAREWSAAASQIITTMAEDSVRSFTEQIVVPMAEGSVKSFTEQIVVPMAEGSVKSFTEQIVVPMAEDSVRSYTEQVVPKFAADILDRDICTLERMIHDSLSSMVTGCNVSFEPWERDLLPFMESNMHISRAIPEKTRFRMLKRTVNKLAQFVIRPQEQFNTAAYDHLLQCTKKINKLIEVVNDLSLIGSDVADLFSLRRDVETISENIRNLNSSHEILENHVETISINIRNLNDFSKIMEQDVLPNMRAEFDNKIHSLENSVMQVSQRLDSFISIISEKIEEQNRISMSLNKELLNVMTSINSFTLSASQQTSSVSALEQRLNEKFDTLSKTYELEKIRLEKVIDNLNEKISDLQKDTIHNSIESDLHELSNTVTNNQKWLELIADRVDNDIAARIDSIESNSNETCAKYGEDIQALSNTVTNNEKWLELVADRVDNDIAARIDSIESNSNETCAKYGEDIQALCDTVTNNQKWLELVADRVDNGIAAHIDSIEKDLIEHNVKHEEEIHTLCNTINNNQKWLELLANRVDSNEKWLGTTNKRIDICNTFIDGNDNCSYSSYSQCGEDIIVQNLLERMETQPQKLSYLDIGGNDYKHLNNTYLMYSRGLSGVIIEANPFLADELKKHRSRDNVLNIGIGATKGELDFYIINGGGFSSFNKEFIDKTLANNPDATIDDVIKVKVLDFNTVVKQYCEGTPDIVSIDIEGDELSVLKSVDFEKYRPLVFIVESIYCTEHVDLNAKRYDIGEFMKSRGYHEYAFTGVNSIFVDTKRFNSVIGE